MELEKYISEAVEKIKLLGIQVTDETKQNLKANVLKTPADILEDLCESQILGLIFNYLGMIVYDKERNKLLTNSIYSFDMEIFNIDTMYIDFFYYINILTNNELKIKVIEEDITNIYDAENGIHTIRFSMLGKEYKFDADAKYDWFDIRIISYINKILEKNNSDKFLYTTSDGWQNCIVFYNTKEWARDYNKYFKTLRIERI